MVVEIVQGKYGLLAKIEGDENVVVSCLLRREDESIVKKGNKVVIKGRCRGYYKAEKLVDLNSGVLINDKEKDKRPE